MLYISPLFKLDKLRETLGFAEDLGILAINDTFAENNTSLSQFFGIATECDQAEGIKFDSAKSELPIFSRRLSWFEY
ncbi:hypothetical protein GcC1_168028 [Golovinomyces cichoracearum]|uniref:Reverse transcriptase domain-containing protein n=1 Tax=Golovinomyces cichoracearum TaxID=62708 RepID=A0A420HRX3_9PEZI|nr:hypothetical protein GcC1_168028 [Golovinomyces cichoracearum]